MFTWKLFNEWTHTSQCTEHETETTELEHNRHYQWRMQYIHTYIHECESAWKGLTLAGTHTHTHTHTDAFITNNPSQQQQWYKAAAGHLRHTAAQSTTAIWRPAFHRHWRTILKSTGKETHHQGTSYKPTVLYCASVSIISLYFSTAVVLQSYWYKPKDKQQQTLLLWDQYFTKAEVRHFSWRNML